MHVGICLTGVAQGHVEVPVGYKKVSLGSHGVDIRLAVNKK